MTIEGTITDDSAPAPRQKPAGERGRPNEPAIPSPSPNLGKYFTALRLYQYRRPDMFSTSDRYISNILYLPLPDGLVDATSADWQETQQGALATIFMNAQGDGGTPSFSKGFKSALGAASVGGLPGQFAESVKGLIGRAGPIGEGAKAVLDNMFPADAINAFVQQSFYGGMAQNPNPTVIFKGPDLRSYNLSWTFTPRSATESENTKTIIRLLKQWSLPTPHFGNSMATLAYPGLAMVNFMPWDNLGKGEDGWTNDSIIRYKMSALKSVNVNYAPSNVPAFYADGSNPAIITLSISFQEVEYMVSKDWGGDASYFADNSGKDAFSMAWDTIEYIAGTAYDTASKGLSELVTKVESSSLFAGQKQQEEADKANQDNPNGDQTTENPPNQ